MTIGWEGKTHLGVTHSYGIPDQGRGHHGVERTNLRHTSNSPGISDKHCLLPRCKPHLSLTHTHSLLPSGSFEHLIYLQPLPAAAPSHAAPSLAPFLHRQGSLHGKSGLPRWTLKVDGRGLANYKDPCGELHHARVCGDPSSTTRSSTYSVSTLGTEQ